MVTDSSLTFEPLGPVALDRWLDDMFEDYVVHRVAAGDTEHEARTNAAAARELRVPDGVPGPGQHIGRVLRDGVPVGYLWIGPADVDPRRWWVSNVVVDEDQRGRGLGRRTMLLAEEIAREQGATSLGLNVFATNDAARHLYASLDYEESSVVMRKAL